MVHSPEKPTNRNGELIVLYKELDNAEARRKHDASAYTPLAKDDSGPKKCDIRTGANKAPAGPDEIRSVSTLYCDSKDALNAWSPKGQARALANFPRAELHFFATKDV